MPVTLKNAKLLLLTLEKKEHALSFIQGHPFFVSSCRLSLPYCPANTPVGPIPADRLGTPAGMSKPYDPALLVAVDDDDAGVPLTAFAMLSRSAFSVSMRCFSSFVMRGLRVVVPPREPGPPPRPRPPSPPPRPPREPGPPPRARPPRPRLVGPSL